MDDEFPRVDNERVLAAEVGEEHVLGGVSRTEDENHPSSDRIEVRETRYVSADAIHQSGIGTRQQLTWLASKSCRSRVVIEVDQELEELVRRAEAEWIERFVAGPEKLRWDELPPQVGDPAPDLEVRDTTGTRRQLHEIWADGPALLLFWRHFGCGCGLDRADRLAGEYDDYLDAGATVAIVGEGDPERGAAYREEYDIECPVLCDPDGGAHGTYGLLDFTIAQTLYHLPELVERDRAAIEAIADRKREEGLPQVDNPWRQPGEFVVDEDGVLRLTYRYQYCRDFPDPRVLLTAIREAKR